MCLICSVLKILDLYLIEIKCPYKWRKKSLHDACKDKEFCCFLDDNNEIQLKKNHRYYTQIQGQMGVCKMQKCDFVLYTVVRRLCYYNSSI